MLCVMSKLRLSPSLDVVGTLNSSFATIIRPIALPNSLDLPEHRSFLNRLTPLRVLAIEVHVLLLETGWYSPMQIRIRAKSYLTTWRLRLHRAGVWLEVAMGNSTN